MSVFENDQQYLSKIRRMIVDDPMRMISEIHEAHYLYESHVISEECYKKVKELAQQANLFKTNAEKLK